MIGNHYLLMEHLEDYRPTQSRRVNTLQNKVSMSKYTQRKNNIITMSFLGSDIVYNVVLKSFGGETGLNFRKKYHFTILINKLSELDLCQVSYPSQHTTFIWEIRQNVKTTS